MSIEGEYFIVPDSAISTFNAERDFRVETIARGKEESRALELVRGQAGYTERFAEIMADPEYYAAAAWEGQESYARGISVLAAGLKVGDSIIYVSDMIINTDRQGSGVRAIETVKHLVSESNAKSVMLTCTEFDIKFFRELFPDAFIFEYDEEGEEMYKFTIDPLRL